jgi:uncharacterized tellurite resistance protein B-like protein
MSRADFKSILRFLAGGEPSPEERAELFREAALMALARATNADTNIKPIEVETVQRILKRVTGDDFATSEIQVAAKSAVFETKPLDRYLAGIGRKLDSQQRSTLVGALAEVIRSDERISHFETDYYDMVVKALGATPSEIAGLTSHD